MTLGLLFILLIICVICRIIIFKKRDVKPWQALIPAYNKYKLGRLAKAKKLGIINAIAHTVFDVFFIFCFTFEFWIITNYADYIQVPEDGVSDSVIRVAVPDTVANIAIYSKYILIILAIFTFVVWCMMMWKFTIAHKKSPWWILLWAVIPVIPYIYFAAISDVLSIDGKRYSIQKTRVVIKE